MDNSINFKGSFLVKGISPELKETIRPILGTKDKNKIIDNVLNQGNTLFVAYENLDQNIAKVLLHTPNVKFKYFPNITPKSGFVNFDANEAKCLLKEHLNTAISTKGKLLKAIRKPFAVKKLNIQYVQGRNLKCTQKVFFLDLNDKDYLKDLNLQTGEYIVRTRKLYKDRKTGTLKPHTLLQITPPGKYGISYATYIPISEQENTRRIAIKNGEKIFEYTGPYSQTFKNNEEAAKQHYRELMSK